MDRCVLYMRFVTCMFCFAAFASCANNADGDNDLPVETGTTPVINYTVTKVYPHDTTAFTEGLVVYNDKLYESTGSPPEMKQTRSLIGEVDLTNGKILEKVELDREKYFGEGIVFLHNKLYQLTYRSKIGFVYDAKSFQKSGEFSFSNNEGWGLTTDGTYLIMSDGTNVLTYLDPTSFRVVKTINVTDKNGAVQNLNELEYINGFIYANVFTTNNIVKINAETGAVAGKLDLTSLANEASVKYTGSLELNGIAYDSAKNVLYVTGKMWPSIYEINSNF